MKRKLIGISLILVLALAGCGGDVTEPGKPTTSTDLTNTAVPLGYSASNLVANGAATLDSVVSSYTCFADPTLTARVKRLADYTLFPVGDHANKNFAQRMGDVMLGDDNVIKVQALRQTLAAGSVPALGASRPGRGLVTTEPFEGYNDCITAAGAGLNMWIPGLGSVFTSIFGGPSEEEQFRKKVEKQLDKINQTLGQMQQEMRQGFASLHGQINGVLASVRDVKGDISLVNAGVTMLLSANVSERINNFNAKVQDYKDAPNVTTASNILYTYFTTGSFSGDMNNFVDNAIAMQAWGRTNSAPYPAMLYSDPQVRADALMVTGTKLPYHNTLPANHDYDYNFNYENPKRDIPISLGNLEMLADMMLTQLQMNHVLYTDKATLTIANRNKAQTFLNLLESSGIRTQILSAANKMINKINAACAYADKNFDGLFYGGSSYPEWCLWTEGNAQVVWYYYSASAGKQLLRSEFNKAFQDYIGPFFARLIALEVHLRSYL